MTTEEHSGHQGILIESEGHRLLGTLFLARGNEPKPTALLLHGMPGIEKNYDIAFLLRENGWNSLIFHYRGSWGSGGNYAFKTIPTDVRAALDTVSGGAFPLVDPERLVLIGHSLGGWAAVMTALDDPRVRAVAVYGAVADPRQMRFTEEEVRVAFTDWLSGITPARFLEQWAALDEEWTPVEQVYRLAPRPLLVLHGQADTVVPWEQGQALYDGARDRRQLILVPEADHNFSWRRTLLHQYLLNWLDGLF